MLRVFAEKMDRVEEVVVALLRLHLAGEPVNMFAGSD